MKNKKYSAFTLVELIVVIVILAVLATIAFLAYSNHSAIARDSTRISDLSNIAKGLTVNAAAANKFPIPDKFVIDIFSGSIQIGYQGNAGDSTIRVIKGSADGYKDPLDKTYYTYNTNLTQTKYQVMAFLERKSSLTFNPNPFDEMDYAFATDYTNRYPYERGDGLGIFLSTSTSTGSDGTSGLTYTPIQDVLSIQTSTGFDILDPADGSGVVAITDNSLPESPVSDTVFIGYTSTGSSYPIGTGGEGGGGVETPPSSESVTTSKRLAVGSSFSCALKADGTVYCWGYNGNGQIGDNTLNQRNIAFQTKGVGGAGNITSIGQVAAGASHACALKTDGTVYCWGLNTNGQLGDGTTTQKTTPVQVTGLSGITKIGLGNTHSCALKTDGTVYCWGLNTNGQLGDGTTTQSLSPVQVTGLSGVIQIAGGTSNSCALKSDGTVYCWGLNTNGQLGDGTTTQSLSPVQVKGIGGTGVLSGISQIGTGRYHSCALKSDGTVYCWGKNANGQLGDNTINQSTYPVQVVGVGGTGVLSGISQVAGGTSHSCALKSDGTEYCWGGNSFGQLGDNSYVQKNYPIQVLGAGGTGVLSGLTEITSGFSHNCALKSDGTEHCWGYNYYGSLGDNTAVEKKFPVQVQMFTGSGNISNIASIAVAYSSACFVKNDGKPYCWGDGSSGQLGDGTNTGKNYPVQPVGLGGAGNLTDVVQIAEGGRYSCALKTDGTVLCWGINTSGQLGDGTKTTRNIPAYVGSGGVNLTGVAQISAADRHTCAVKTDGTVFCWGNNQFGYLGDNTNWTERLTPVQVKGVGGTGFLTGVKQVALGYTHSCALKTDGTVFCWGDNTMGELGNNSTTQEFDAPVQVKGVGGTGFLTGVTQISAGVDSYGHTCALKSDGTVYCWGENGYGMLGNDTTTLSRTPVQVLGVGGSGVLSGISHIGGGFNHTCAVKTDGTAYCWGINNNGQLGDGTNIQRLTPVQVVGVGGSGFLSDVASIGLVGYSYNTCALRNDGTAACWGYNNMGQLGDLTTNNSSSPVNVIWQSSGPFNIN